MSQFAVRSATDKVKFSFPLQFYFQRTADCNVLFCKKRIILFLTLKNEENIYLLYFTAVTPSLYFVSFPVNFLFQQEMHHLVAHAYRTSTNRQTVHAVAQVTHSIPHNEMQFSDCIRTEHCLYDLSNRTDREAVFSDCISLSYNWGGLA